MEENASKRSFSSLANKYSEVCVLKEDDNGVPIERVDAGCFKRKVLGNDVNFLSLYLEEENSGFNAEKCAGGEVRGNTDGLNNKENIGGGYAEDLNEKESVGEEYADGLNKKEREIIKSDGSYKMEIVWKNVLIMSLLHLAGVYGFFLRHTETKFSTIVFAKLVYVLSGLGITAGAHRLWSHKCYKANSTAQIILMLLNSATYQNSIYTWSRDHRIHHKYTETDADPHNSKRGFFFSHMGWLLVKKHPELKAKGVNIDMSDLQANKIVMFQHRNYYFLVLLLGVLIPTFVPWYFWKESLKSSFFVATIYRYIISMHVTWSINSFAHMFGSKPYEKNIRPSENVITIFTTNGEGYHNYHHTFPWDYRASELSFDTRNMSTLVIDFFCWLGWASDLRSVPKEFILKRLKKTGDGSYRNSEEGNILMKTLNHLKNFIIFWGIVCII